MSAFRYQAVESTGKSVEGVIEADDRKSALQLLGQRGLFPSNLESCATNGHAAAAAAPAVMAPAADSTDTRSTGFRFGRRRVRRKEITAFTREMSALLGSAIPIPQALTGIGEEEENPALREMILSISESVRKGASF